MNDQVTRLFEERQPGPTIDDLGPTYVSTARAIAAICATRLLLLIAVVTGCAIWLWTTYQPTPERLYVAAAFSIVFVLPQVVLYLKRG